MSHLDPSPKPAPSPFLPGTALQHTWDSTSLGWLKECPRKYEYQMIRGFRPKGTTSVHLVFGQHYHSALELYDKLKASHLQNNEPFDHDLALCEVLVRVLQWTWIPAPVCDDCRGSGFTGQGSGYGDVCATCGGTKTLGEGRPWQADHPSKNRETLIRSVIWYLEEFRDDPAQTLILANGKPAVELSFKFDSGIGIEFGDLTKGSMASYTLSGHLDRLVTFQDAIYVMDHKTTTSQLDARFFDQFNPHSQMSLYTIAGQVVYSSHIKGVLIGGVQIMVGFTRFGRGFAPRTPGLNEEYLTDLEPWLRAAERYAAARQWPKNETSCGNYGGCIFRRICSKDPSVRERFLATDFEVNPWNPLQDR